MLHTLLSAVLLLAARLLILTLLPSINRTKLNFLCFFFPFIRLFYNFWSNFWKKWLLVTFRGKQVTFSDFLRKNVTLSDQSWKKVTKWHPCTYYLFILQKAETCSHAMDIQTVLINYSFSQQKSVIFRDFTWLDVTLHDFTWLYMTLGDLFPKIVTSRVFRDW